MSWTSEASEAALALTLPPLALSIASKLIANNRGYPESEYGSKCNDANLGIVTPA
jgi:hypothetical protein